MMKTAEKLAAGWLLTLGFMLLVQSASAVANKITMYKPMPPGIEKGTDEDFINNEAVAQLDNTAVNGLIFGVPSLVLGGWLTLGLYRQSRQEKKAINQQLSDRLQSTFYRMIEENHGRVSLLNFAIQSQLPASTAREYLDQRAKEFNANFKVSEDGAVSYHFDV